MPTGFSALILACVGLLAWGWVVVRLSRRIPPTADSAERAWRDGWLVRLYPFGKPRLAPIGQPEPVPRALRTPRTRRLRMLAGTIVFVATEIILLLHLDGLGEPGRPMLPTWAVLLVLIVGGTGTWLLVRRQKGSKARGR